MRRKWFEYGDYLILGGRLGNSSESKGLFAQFSDSLSTLHPNYRQIVDFWRINQGFGEDLDGLSGIRPNLSQILHFPFTNQRFDEELDGSSRESTQIITKSLIFEGKLKDMVRIWTASREALSGIRPDLSQILHFSFTNQWFDEDLDGFPRGLLL